MTDNKDDKTLNPSGKKTLKLKQSGVSQGTVRQDMGRGRSKAVVVETRKRRVHKPNEEASSPSSSSAPAQQRSAATPQPQQARTNEQPAPKTEDNTRQQRQPQGQPSRGGPSGQARGGQGRGGQNRQRGGQGGGGQPNRGGGSGQGRQGGNVLHGLSQGEMDARRKALIMAQQREVEEAERRKREEEERQKAEAEAKRQAEEDAKRQAEEDSRQAAEAAAKAKEEPKPEPKQAEPEDPAAVAPPPIDSEKPGRAAPRVRPASRAEKDDDDSPARGRKPRRDGDDAAPARGKAVRPETPAKPAARPKGAGERRRGKLTVTTVSADDDGSNERGRSLSAMRRRQQKMRRAQTQEPREKISREVVLPETITIQELSQRMSERAVDVIKYLMKEGQMMKPGDVIDADLAELIASEFGHTVKRVAESDVEEGIFDVKDEEADLKSRAPVVTIMGHVDHGKTSLLDAIRHANVVSGEAGGITQHIGAYQVEQDGQKITFIDTPGHAAFTAMRARGAEVTDVAILVVAADDSVMPQTIESINHAKAAGVPIIVAINKIDKPAADAQKVRTELLQHEVFVESMGGEVLEVEVSAKTGQGLDKILEAILLQSEILDLKANPDRTAEGVVIEAQLDRGRGSVATVLVQKGTLKPGQVLVAGDQWGRVRALINDRGEHVKEAGPSMPVEILGLGGTPSAGDRFAVVENEAKAREVSEYRQRLARDKAAARQSGSRGSLEQMMSQLQDTGLKEFPLLIKGDVQGSVEAINAALEKLGTDEVRARVVHAAAGGITESDISLAEASDAAIIGFNVRANAQARRAADQAGIEIRYYNIIYDLVDDVKAAMSGLLSPERRETFLGNAEILEVFNISKTGKVAGCQVTEGKVERGAGVRLIRDNVVIHEGKLKTLKRFKDEVSEVPVGQECGMAFENYEDMRKGDIIEAFRVEHVTRTL
ncbi:translation initiation factor IF-2 [Martelella mediterranea]|uniref:Translation initiation factor IF-2 n=1 Tax=Martelella mediterranea TaxID=293089 RepID=A0A4R3NVU6_9HYPH|nr:translation initiation factor IF-2 [Martelella mediterranea]TCT41808.1 translation initiation factor 2 (bIF-2) [Martelella mediterranea]